MPSALIGAVSVAPEHRGGGAGTAIVADYLRVARDAGLAISSLYPASYPLYHHSGYEHAGAVVRYDLPVASLVGRPADDGVTVREHDGDDATLKAIYDRFAHQTPGLLQRLELHWGGILGPRGRQAFHRYVAERDGEPIGYLAFTQRHAAAGRLLEVWDLAVTERLAARALLGFLGAHRHNVTTVRLHGGPNDPRLIDVPQPGASVSALEPWMLRVLDVRAALEARGYPPGVTAELPPRPPGRAVAGEHGPLAGPDRGRPRDHRARRRGAHPDDGAWAVRRLRRRLLRRRACRPTALDRFARRSRPADVHLRRPAALDGQPFLSGRQRDRECLLLWDRSALRPFQRRWRKGHALGLTSRRGGWSARRGDNGAPRPNRWFRTT